MQFLDPLSLRLFIATWELQSLTDAADRESLTVSAVSKRLAALEEQIGTPLLNRARRGVQLTPAGEALLPAARGLLESLLRVQADVSAYARSAPGRVRLAATLSALTSSLPAEIASFQGLHPEVEVIVEQYYDVVAAVEQGLADVGVCWEGTGSDRLPAKPYRSDRLVVVANKRHALAELEQVSFADTLPYNRVMVDTRSFLAHLQQRLSIAQGKVMNVAVHVKTYETACHVVAAGLGISIVPEAATSVAIRALDLQTIPLSDDWAEWRLVLCVREPRSLSASARLLLDFLGG